MQEEARELERHRWRLLFSETRGKSVCPSWGVRREHTERDDLLSCLSASLLIPEGSHPRASVSGAEGM